MNAFDPVMRLAVEHYFHVCVGPPYFAGEVPPTASAARLLAKAVQERAEQEVDPFAKASLLDHAEDFARIAQELDAQ